jgi:3-oxoacyl-[acyl-carrier-protein] synthase III
MPLKNASQFGFLSVGLSLPAKRMSVEAIAKDYGYEENYLKSVLELQEKPVADKDDEHPSDLAQRAVENAINAYGINKDQIGMLIYCGLSRDYLPAWNVAIEVIGRLGLTNAVGFELTLGCVAPIFAMQVAMNRGDDGRPPYTVVVTAERWTHTLSKSKQTPTAVLGHADGAAACLLGPNSKHIIRSHPAFKIVPEYNDSVVIPAGGTRIPTSKETLESGLHVRQSKSWDFNQLVERYINSYKQVILGAVGGLGRTIDDITLLLTNQVPPIIRHKLIRGLELDEDITINQFPVTGHIGGADTLISMDQAVRRQKLVKGTTVLVASTFSAFGAIAIDSLSNQGISVHDTDNPLKKVA